MIRRILHNLIARAEARLGVGLDYAHKIADTDTGLLMRYNKQFAYLDPNKHCPAEAYHVARLIAAKSADCGTCVEAEISLAKQAHVAADIIDAALTGAPLPAPLNAVATLAHAVTASHDDAPDARDQIRDAYGEAGLIELSFAMTGAHLLPSLKRAMGYATTCDIDTLRKLSKAG
ncbi:MAG: hypothetical protein AAGK92_11880 [Pseudomonadota bacterium]